MMRAWIKVGACCCCNLGMPTIFYKQESCHICIHQALVGLDPPSFNRRLFIGVLLIGCPLQGSLLDHLKLIIWIILTALWVYRAHGDMLSIIVSNSHFGKRSAARVMTIFSFHFLPDVTNMVFSYWWNFANSASRPSPELIFGLLSMPCAREIRIWVYQLWKMDFLWICWFSMIVGVFNTSPLSFSFPSLLSPCLCLCNSFLLY